MTRRKEMQKKKKFQKRLSSVCQSHGKMGIQGHILTWMEGDLLVSYEKFKIFPYIEKKEFSDLVTTEMIILYIFISVLATSKPRPVKLLHVWKPQAVARKPERSRGSQTRGPHPWRGTHRESLRGVEKSRPPKER